MKKITVLILCLFGSFSVYAGNSNGKVEFLMVHTGDVVIFSAGAHQSKPGCSRVGNAWGSWALSLKTESGKAMYAMLLSAQAQSQSVKVIGESACKAWGDRESPRHMTVKK